MQDPRFYLQEVVTNKSNAWTDPHTPTSTSEGMCHEQSVVTWKNIKYISDSKPLVKMTRVGFEKI